MRSRTALAVLVASMFVAGPSTAAAQAVATSGGAAATAVKASPELVGALSSGLGSTPEQAAGAAGSLFGLAKSRLKPEEFTQVSSAVPGMDSLLAAAPAAGGGAVSALGGSASGLAGMASSFSKLGLKPDMVAKAIPILTNFVSKSGGAGVGQLLAGALK
jgi:hypothetical protein